MGGFAGAPGPAAAGRNYAGGMPLSSSAVPPTSPAAPEPGRLRAGVLTAAAYCGAGILLSLAGINAGGLFPPVIRVPDTFWLPVLLLGCIGLVFRRTNVPLMMALTGTAVGAGVLTDSGIVTYLLLFEVFYSGILFGTPRLSRAVEKAALLTAALLAVGIGMANRDWGYVLFGILQAVLICLIPLWWAGTLRRQTDLAGRERLRADAERLNAERTAEVARLNLLVALATERSTMARELHDAIAGHLSAVALQSAAALAAADPGLDRRVLAQVRSESVQALNEMRAMIDVLQAGGMDGAPPMTGGLGQLEDLSRSARLAGNRVDLVVSGPNVTAADGLPALIHSSTYRIVQESLTNAVKHAPGRTVSVQVRQTAAAVQLEVANDLVPSPNGSTNGTGTGNGTGLRNMALRARQLGGTFSAGPVPGNRWLVQATLPALAGSTPGESSVSSAVFSPAPSAVSPAMPSPVTQGTP